MTAVQYRTDKIMNGYLGEYRRLSAEIRRSVGTREARVLEIGAGDGAGMEFFADLLDTNEVYGVEINGSQGGKLNPAFCWFGDATDPDLPNHLPGPWDLIVDDASHEGGQTSRTLAIMWPTLRRGGVYVIEDWNFYDAQGNGDCLWQKLFGYMLAYSYVGNHYPAPFSGALSDVESVTVQHGLIIVHKGGAEGES